MLSIEYKYKLLCLLVRHCEAEGRGNLGPRSALSALRATDGGLPARSRCNARRASSEAFMRRTVPFSGRSNPHCDGEAFGGRGGGRGGGPSAASAPLRGTAAMNGVLTATPSVSLRLTPPSGREAWAGAATAPLQRLDAISQSRTPYRKAGRHIAKPDVISQGRTPYRADECHKWRPCDRTARPPKIAQIRKYNRKFAIPSRG